MLYTVVIIIYVQINQQYNLNLTVDTRVLLLFQNRYESFCPNPKLNGDVLSRCEINL